MKNKFFKVAVSNPTNAEKERSLTVKPSVEIHASKQGVTYCGFRVSQGAIRLSRRRKRRYQQRRKFWEAQYLAGHKLAS